MSVPVDFLKGAAADIIAYGRVRRPWVGIALHHELDLSKIDELWDQGVLAGSIWFDTTPVPLKIITVNPYSPAYEAGLREGDVIELIDGQRFENIFDVYAYFLNSKLDQEIEFKVLRNNYPRSFVVTVGEKKVRYFGAEVNAGTIRGLQDIGRVSVRTFHSPITY
jgi:serine protease Do